jgi:hypothetical protein
MKGWPCFLFLGKRESAVESEVRRGIDSTSCYHDYTEFATYDIRGYGMIV